MASRLLSIKELDFQATRYHEVNRELKLKKYHVVRVAISFKMEEDEIDLDPMDDLDDVVSGNDDDDDDDEEIRKKFQFLEAKYFKSVEVAKGKKGKNVRFQCQICPKKTTISSSVESTSNLRRHVTAFHKSLLVEFNELVKKNSRKKVANRIGFGIGKVQKQPTITESLTIVTQATLDRLVTDVILKEGLPFSLVESEHFRKLALAGRPGKKVIGRTTLMSRIDEQFVAMKDKLKEDFAKTDYICLTADAWTAARRSYLGVTAHFLREDLSAQSIALACRRLVGKHSYDVLAESLDQIQWEFGIAKKVSCAITDSGSNFVKAFRIFSDVDDDDEPDSGGVEIERLIEDEDPDFVQYKLPKHYRCASHKLNLICTKDSEKALGNAGFKKLSRSTFGKVQALCNKQTRSSQASEIIQENLGRYLLVPNATRWNSSYDSLKLIAEFLDKKPLEVEKVFDKLELPHFSELETSFIKEYIIIMRPLAQALNILQVLRPKCNLLGSCSVEDSEGSKRKNQDLLSKYRPYSTNNYQNNIPHYLLQSNFDERRSNDWSKESSCHNESGLLVQKNNLLEFRGWYTPLTFKIRFGLLLISSYAQKIHQKVFKGQVPCPVTPNILTWRVHSNDGCTSKNSAETLKSTTVQKYHEECLTEESSSELFASGDNQVNNVSPSCSSASDIPTSSDKELHNASIEINETISFCKSKVHRSSSVPVISNAKLSTKDSESVDNESVMIANSVLKDYVSKLQNGFGLSVVNKNCKKAFECFMLASVGSTNSSAMYNLALCYERGTGTDKNMSKALYHYQRAASLGNMKALFNLGVLELSQDCEGSQSDGIKHLKLAAERGIKEAQMYIGWYYSQQNDWENAVRLFKYAAKQKDADAMYYLGLCYENGWGVEVNEAMAAKMYSEASTAGSHDAMYSLAVFYELGCGGLREDKSLSAEMYTMAAERGNKFAQRKLDELNKVQKGDTKNDSIANANQSESCSSVDSASVSSEDELYSLQLSQSAPVLSLSHDDVNWNTKSYEPAYLDLMAPLNFIQQKQSKFYIGDSDDDSLFASNTQLSLL